MDQPSKIAAESIVRLLTDRYYAKGQGIRVEPEERQRLTVEIAAVLRGTELLRKVAKMPAPKLTEKDVFKQIYLCAKASNCVHCRSIANMVEELLK